MTERTYSNFAQKRTPLSLVLLKCAHDQPGARGADRTPHHPQGRPRKMKIAIVHDWLTGMRGGEKVLEAACALFPDAEIYTLIHRPDLISEFQS